ncbi:tetratricopeptide repeat protein [Thermonema rossianum]|uniref:tetratricopeptide repeat protein n=1 Tax=Thermonema rossianum TaxID=55505 RepID=UPI000570E03D|nr:tetratricopeptide repeat protein [Thermonema rossianum]
MLRHSIFCVFLLLLTAGGPAWAQSSKYEALFTEAVRYTDTGQWAEAARIWAQLRVSEPANPYEVEAYYFSALCAFQMQQYDDAEAFLLNILNRTTPWERIDEVFYLLANIAFEKEEDPLAFRYIAKIGNIDLHNAANSMKGYYLQRRPRKVLENLLALYPEDLFLAQIMVNHLAKHARSVEDIALMKRLIAEYNLEVPESISIEVVRPQNDTLYAVLFYNFSLDTLKTIDTLTYKQRMMHSPGASAFWAAKAAEAIVDSLGKRWVLVAYDWQRAKDSLFAWAEYGEFAFADAMIASPEMDAYLLQLRLAEKLGIPVVQVHHGSEDLAASPFSIVMRASEHHESRAMASFLIQKVKTRGILLYTEEMAGKARTQMDRLRTEGIDLSARLVKSEDLPRLSTLLSEWGVTSFDFVYCLSTSQLFEKLMLQYWKDKELKNMLLVPDEWRLHGHLEAKELSGMPVYFVAPEFRPFNTQEPFLAKFNWWAYRIAHTGNYRRPPIEAYLTYDALRLLGRALQADPATGWLSLAGNPPTAMTLRPYLFKKEKGQGLINIFVPILKYEEEKIQIVNYPVHN